MSLAQFELQNQNLEDDSWLFHLRNAIKDPKVLLKELALPLTNFEKDFPAKNLFPLIVPRTFVKRMAKGDINDPLFKQVMPSFDEFIEVEGFITDPLKEQDNEIPNLLHKYHNRVLIMFKNSCAINCRYCFRRHFPYQLNQANKQNLTKVLNYINNNPQIEEVILSGGDPLLAKDRELAWLIDNLAQIKHITKLRIHTRLAVVIPQRITNQLVNLLSNSSLKVIIVSHINHPNEIDETLIKYFDKLIDKRIILLNQSVLLKGINDNALILKNLSDKLFDGGIMPYYLHLLDKVKGASHFYIDDQKAINIYRELQAICSGYLVPKLAREISGKPNKTLFC